ncbi:MAG TPA: hypothetical protein VHW04_04965 [Solirubrobacteraceae bacterium]|nr:hypothetical protein [Solirubrobacteraceae bacterium]
MAALGGVTIGTVAEGRSRRRAWPDYTFSCKRVLFSSHYLPTLALPDVELVADAITEVEAASDRELQARFDGTAWMACDSWYRGQDGRIVANWPGYIREYMERTSKLDPDEYVFR